MNDDLLQDIEEARDLLEKFEAETEHVKRSRNFEDAIDVLNDCLSESIDSSLKTQIENLKLTYTKKLLESISSLLTTDIDIWFEYTKLFVWKVPNEVKAIIADHPDINKNYSKFIKLWVKEAIDILGRAS